MILVNQNKWHWFGTLSVAPNGRIDVCVAGYTQCREQHRLAIILFLEHRWRRYLGA